MESILNLFKFEVEKASTNACTRSHPLTRLCWAGQGPRAWNLSQVSHVGSSPHCCLSGSAPAASWSLEPRPGMWKRRPRCLWPFKHLIYYKLIHYGHFFILAHHFTNSEPQMTFFTYESFDIYCSGHENWQSTTDCSHLFSPKCLAIARLGQLSYTGGRIPITCTIMTTVNDPHWQEAARSWSWEWTQAL